jgi:hypothetical protein
MVFTCDDAHRLNPHKEKSFSLLVFFLADYKVGVTLLPNGGMSASLCDLRSSSLIAHLSSTFSVASMRATITFELGSLVCSLSHVSTRFTMTSSLRSSPRGCLLTPTLLPLSTAPPSGASPCARPPLLPWVACRRAFMLVCLSIVRLHVPSLPAQA